jgi:arsenate reductase
MPAVTLYGIPNCNTVKQARDWLEQHGIDYRFHDFKKTGVDTALIDSWLPQVGLALLINRKGTTWRGLDDSQKAAATDRQQAIALMIASPSVIKRPVLSIGGNRTVVGFSTALYQELFSTHNKNAS